MKNYIEEENSDQVNQINQINQINGCEKRSNQSFHMRPSIANSGREYAKALNIQSGEFAEKAFIEYMSNHPANLKIIVVQNKLSSDIPKRVDLVKIKAISTQLEFIIKRFKELGEEKPSTLVETLASALMKGAAIKQPTDEFLLLMEEAMRYL